MIGVRITGAVPLGNGVKISFDRETTEPFFITVGSWLIELRGDDKLAVRTWPTADPVLLVDAVLPGADSR